MTKKTKEEETLDVFDEVVGKLALAISIVLVSCMIAAMLVVPLFQDNNNSHNSQPAMDSTIQVDWEGWLEAGWHVILAPIDWLSSLGNGSSTPTSGCNDYGCINGGQSPF